MNWPIRLVGWVYYGKSTLEIRFKHIPNLFIENEYQVIRISKLDWGVPIAVVAKGLVAAYEGDIDKCRVELTTGHRLYLKDIKVGDRVRIYSNQDIPFEKAWPGTWILLNVEGRRLMRLKELPGNIR